MRLYTAHDLVIPAEKQRLVQQTQEKVAEYEQQYQDGLITQGEKYNKVVDAWSKCTDDVAAAMMKGISQPKKGAPITRVLSPDVPLVSFFSLAVPKHATNSNAAKLFIVYMLSKRGQRDQLELSTSTDLHLFEDSHIRKEIVAQEKKYGITFKHADIAWQLRNDAGNAAQQKVAEILRTSGKR